MKIAEELTEMVSETLVNCHSFDDALETLSYALEFISCNTTIDKSELKQMLCHAYGSVKSLADYHGRITDDIENIWDELSEGARNE